MMFMRLIREPTFKETTLGVFMVDGEFFCFSLEDAVREVSGVPVSQWKVKGKTAIPAGRYRVSLTWSVRFNRILPEVHEVPGFSGIRIHSGNVVEDTEGCVILGVVRDRAMVRESRTAVARLQGRLDARKEEDHFLLIENPILE